MDSLTIDVRGYLSEFIETNKDKCHLMMTCKEISKCRFFFYEKVNIENIIELLWFDNFINVYVAINKCNKFPAFVTHLDYGHYYDKSLCDYFFPSTVIHLKFSYGFNEPIDDKIPFGVTHLSFGYTFKLKKMLPSSIIHLEFGHYFNHPIKDYIPSSVTHLTLGTWFSQDITESLPSSVTHLTFVGKYVRQLTSIIPNTITHLTADSILNLLSDNLIPSSVTHLTIHSYINKNAIKFVPSTVKYLKYVENSDSDEMSELEHVD